MHLELGQRTGDLFHVFRSQYKFGGFDVLLKVLDLARSGDRDDERLLGQEPCERQLRCVAFFLPASSVMRSTKGLLAAMQCGQIYVVLHCWELSRQLFRQLARDFENCRHIVL